MPRSKAPPLTLAQQALIYDAYNCDCDPAPTMAVLALQYQVSISVIHRAIHNEAFRRAEVAGTNRLPSL